MSNGNNHIDAVTPWGKFTIWGKDLILVIMMAAFIGATFWEQKQRQIEHNDISCLLRLQIWTQIASEADLSLRRIPKEYWRCLPEAFLRLRDE